MVTTRSQNTKKQQKQQPDNPEKKEQKKKPEKKVETKEEKKIRVTNEATNVITKLLNDDVQIDTDKLYSEAKKENNKVTRKLVKEVIEKNEGYQQQQSTNTKKNRMYSTSFTRRPLDTLQFDIMYLPNDKRYIVTCIDVYSRKTWYRLIKKREKEYIIDAINQILKQKKKDAPEVLKDVKIDNVRYDNEFNREDINEIFSEQDTTVRPSKPNDKIHQGHIERFHRTLRNLIRKWTLLQKQRNVNTKANSYIQHLTNIIDSYNNKKHSQTHQSPDDLFKLKEGSDEKFQKAVFNYKPGDIVRTIKERNTFSKSSSTPTYSADKFIIVRIVDNKYHLRNIKNKRKEEPYGFRGNELLLVSSASDESSAND